MRIRTNAYDNKYKIISAAVLRADKSTTEYRLKFRALSVSEILGRTNSNDSIYRIYEPGKKPKRSTQQREPWLNEISPRYCPRATLRSPLARMHAIPENKKTSF